MTAIGLIGVPTSAGAFAPGQERAPEALRAAGLVELLRAAGLDVRDHGDRPVWRWRPDRQSRFAQNAEQVAKIVRETADRVADAASADELTVVLGGDCTVGIGTVAGHVRAAGSSRVGLLYVDLHADLNVPDSVREGALDWMGMAHMLGEDGAVPDLAEAGPRTPLLTPEQVLLFGWGPDRATTHEREAIDRLGLRTAAVDEVAVNPVAAAARALADIEQRCDRLLVHFDVDTIDFTDTPLSEETGRNRGLSYQSALAAVKVILESSKLAGLTVTELNPAHVEEGAGAVRRLAADLAEGLGAHAATRDTGTHGTTPAPAIIRRAADSDADTVARLLVDFNTEYDEPTPDPAALAVRVGQLLAGGETVILLADTGGEPAAVAVMRFRLSVWSPAKECYLAELYVVPARRGQGIGRALMTAAMDLARAEGADHMDLGTAETDAAARGLYESLGFGNREGRADGPVNFFYEREL